MAPINLEAVKVVLGGAGAEEGERKGPLVLPEVIQAGGQNDMLFRVACKHTREGLSPAEVFAVVKAIQVERAPSAPGEPPWTDGDIHAIVASAARYGPTEDHWARTESGDAEVFAHLFGDDVRFDCKRKRWLRYEGHRWVSQSAKEVERLALDAVRWRQACTLKIEDMAKRKTAMDWAIRGESSQRRRNLLELAKQEDPIMDDGLRWDQDTNLMCFSNGVLQLDTGTFRPGRPTDSITKQAAAPWDPAATSELWDRVLTTAIPDQAVREFLQILAGLTMAGVSEENVLVLIYGVTRSAKGTVLDALKSALADYSVTADISTLLVRKKEGGAPRPDVMALIGARMVAIYEVGRSAKLDVTVVKTITGSDTISARQLQSEQIEFKPTFVPWVATDTRPVAPHDDDAFYERLCEVPFKVYIPKEKRDKKVRMALTTKPAEQAAVLAWAWKGYQAYIKAGERLTRPLAVVEAGEEFRAEMNPFRKFLDEGCVFNPRAQVLSKYLRMEYENWCRENGEHPGRNNDLADELAKRGCKKAKLDSQRGWHGVRLASTLEEEEASAHLM